MTDARHYDATDRSLPGRVARTQNSGANLLGDGWPGRKTLEQTWVDGWDGWPGRKILERTWVPRTSVLRAGLLTFPRISTAISC